MKRLAVVGGLLLACIVFQSLANAGNWDKFLAIQNRFYTLDSQKLNHVQCQIQSTDVDSLTRLIRAAAAQMPGPPLVDAQIDNYSLDYDLKKGVTITDPTLAIVPSPDSGKSLSKEQFQQIELAQRGFKMMTAGIDSALKQLFAGMRVPQPGQIDILYVNHQDGTDTVAYTRNNIQIVVTLKGTTVTVKSQRGMAAMKLVKQNETLPDGKLLETTELLTVHSALVTNTVDSKLSYQKVNGVLFPAKINSDSKIVLPDSKQETQIDVELKSCKAS